MYFLIFQKYRVSKKSNTTRIRSRWHWQRVIKKVRCKLEFTQRSRQSAPQTDSLFHFQALTYLVRNRF